MKYKFARQLKIGGESVTDTQTVYAATSSDARKAAGKGWVYIGRQEFGVHRLCPRGSRRPNTAFIPKYWD